MARQHWLEWPVKDSSETSAVILSCRFAVGLFKAIVQHRIGVRGRLAALINIRKIKKSVELNILVEQAWVSLTPANTLIHLFVQVSLTIRAIEEKPVLFRLKRHF